MRVSESIFDSGAERAVFSALESRWAPTIRPYPQLPLAKLVKLEASDRLGRGEERFFYATNVDYTFCVDRCKPLFSIEFDGIGGGYSANGEYHQIRSTSDPHRELKMNFKLRVSEQVGYPIVVVSFDELEELDAGESLTILDGIVAQFVSHREEKRLIEEAVEDQRTIIDRLDKWDRDEYIQDIVLEAGVQAEMDHDPLSAARWQALDELGARATR